ncbi:MAG: phosphotransferase, partial [Pseudomonadota bacterium]
KRCTFSGAGDDGRKVFVKSFADERAEDLWRDALSLADAADRGAFGFEIAAPVWFDPGANALALAALNGVNAAPLLRGNDGETHAISIARALATILLSGVVTRAAFDAADQLARTRKYAKRFKKCAPQLSPTIERFLHTLDGDDLHNNQAPELLPVHGAPHPQQWLIDGDRLGLVDFDRFGLGHVELDAATFVAELDFENMPATRRNNIGAAFVDEYKRHLNAFDDRVFMIFRAHKHFAKAFKTAIAIRPDRIDRAEAILAGAQELLDGERS